MPVKYISHMIFWQKYTPTQNLSFFVIIGNHVAVRFLASEIFIYNICPSAISCERVLGAKHWARLISNVNISLLFVCDFILQPGWQCWKRVSWLLVAIVHNLGPILPILPKLQRRAKKQVFFASNSVGFVDAGGRFLSDQSCCWKQRDQHHSNRSTSC